MFITVSLNNELHLQLLILPVYQFRVMNCIHFESYILKKLTNSNIYESDITVVVTSVISFLTYLIGPSSGRWG